MFTCGLGDPGGIGKTTSAQKLSEILEDSAILSPGDYKKSRKERTERNVYGPHPEANRIDMVVSHLEKLKNGQNIQKPVYCREKGKINCTEEFVPARYNIIEGEISIYGILRHLMDFSMYIDSHWKTQLNTRARRDADERGYSPIKII